MKSSDKSKEIYQFKISLNDVHLPIWRRVLLPSTATFKDLHKVIQVAFGWRDSHMHQFVIGGENTDHMYIVSKETEDHLDMDNSSTELRMAEETTTLFDIIPKMAKKLMYEYDFGDNWQHTVALEKTVPYKSGQSYPACIAGENACLPEDCGGAPGYENLCKVLGDPKNPEHKEMLKWLDIKKASEFDPYMFNLKKTNDGVKDCLMVRSSYT